MSLKVCEQRPLPWPLTDPGAPWELVSKKADGRAYMHRKWGLSVIVSAAIEQDGMPWLHLSLARQDRLPSYSELKAVKSAFAGKASKAIQVFAPLDEHVNIHPNCLHLWVPIGHDPLPDFTAGSGMI